MAASSDSHRNRKRVLTVSAQIAEGATYSIILVTVPLAATGVIPGLLISGEPFGFQSLLGVFALAGVVVNNAIVLIDRIEIQRSRGAPLVQAVQESVAVRTRPIFLTTATTVFGLLPLAFSQ